jgi:hypothetical protein
MGWRGKIVCIAAQREKGLPSIETIFPVLVSPIKRISKSRTDRMEYVSAAVARRRMAA